MEEFSGWDAVRSSEEKRSWMLKVKVGQESKCKVKE